MALPGQWARTITFAFSTRFICRRSQLIRALARCLLRGAFSTIEQDTVRRCRLAVTSRSLAAS